MRRSALAGLALLTCSGTGAPAHADLAAPDYRGVRQEPVSSPDPTFTPKSTAPNGPVGALYSVAMAPVLFCNNQGGGPNEYAVPAGAGVSWLLEVPDPPPGAAMYDARYEPYDNIAGVIQFSRILVQVVDNAHVRVTAAAYPNCNTRIRLRITASYAK